MSKTKVIILMGPTASGKTSLAVRLALPFNGEIISADSRQVYRKMDIGSGKDLEEYGDVPYHLIDVKEPDEEFSVSDFQQLVWDSLEQIKARNRLPIICGGTGHYIKALLEDYQFDHDKTNLSLAQKLESESRGSLQQKIKDLGIWEDHHWENDSKRRMVRAIEKKMLGYSKTAPEFGFSENFESRIYYVAVEREVVKERIKNRLDQRLNQGMIKEVEGLLELGISHQRLERFGLEYKYLSLYLKGEITRKVLEEKLFVEISRFAKRQMTFIRFMQKSGHQLIPIRSFDELHQDVSQFLNGS